MRSRPAFAVLAATTLAALVATSGASYADAGDPVDLGGEPLPAGAASPNPLEPSPVPPGLWTADLPPNAPLYFTYQRRINGSTLHIGVTGTPLSGENDALKVEAAVLQEDSSDPLLCGSADDSTEFAIPFAVLGASLAVGVGTGTTDEACRAADTVQIAVDRGAASASGDLPFALKVVEEAPGSGGGAEEPDELAYTAPEPGSATDTTDGSGGSSFDDAPLLVPQDAESGVVTVSATVTEGTEMLWRVPVGWGDVPIARVDVPAATGDDAETFEFSGPDLTLHWVDSMRGRFRDTDSATDDSSTGEYVADEADEASVLVAAGLPVRRANGLLPGDYWISLAVEPAPEDRDPVAVPVELTVTLGHVDGATPTYDQTVLAQDKSAVPEGYSPQRPFLVAEGVFAEVASGNPASDTLDGDAWLTTRRWAGIGVAVLSVGCLAFGAVRLRRR